MRWDIVLFDLDGTLFDSMREHAEIFAALLEGRVSHDEAIEGYMESAGQPVVHQFRQVAERNPVPDEELRRLVAQFFDQIAKSTPRLFRDVKASVKALSAMGCILGVSTNVRTEVVESRLRRVGIRTYFDFVLGSDPRNDATAKGIGHFTTVMRALGLDRETFGRRAVFVGDAEHDMLLARQFGLEAVGRIHSEDSEMRKRLMQAGAACVVDDLRQLVTLVSKR